MEYFKFKEFHIHPDGFIVAKISEESIISIPQDNKRFCLLRKFEDFKDKEGNKFLCIDKIIEGDDFIFHIKESNSNKGTFDIENEFYSDNRMTETFKNLNF